MNINQYKEKIPHGNILFPMSVHVTEADDESREKLYCHWHEELEFLFVTQGGAEFHIGTRSHRVLAGEAIFIRPNQLHSATAIDSLNCAFFAVVISPTLLMSHTDDLIQQKYVDSVLNMRTIFPEHIKGSSEWDSKVIELLRRIKDLFLRQEDGFELLIKTMLFEIWYLLTMHSDGADTVEVRNNDYRVTQIKNILNYIHQNYSQEITLSDISTFSHLSQGQFCRFFKRMVGMSAINYVNYYRICKCVSLLENTDKKISDIAGSVGFSNTSYFCKMFRKYMQCSPSDYRRGEYPK